MSNSAASFAVLFDLDGTLVDSIELIRRSFRHACAAVLEREIAEAEWLSGVGTPLRTQMQGFARTEADVDALIAAYRAYQIEHHDRLLAEYAGVRDMLATLSASGHPIGIVTSKADALAIRALDAMRLRRFADVVIGCDSCSRHKPDPEPVHIALDRLGASPDRAAFAGDSPHDIVAGNAAGVRTIGVLWGPFPRAELERAGAGHLIDRPDDLPPLIRRLAQSSAA